VPLLMILLLTAMQIELRNSLMNPSTVAAGLKQARRHASTPVHARMILLIKIGWLVLSSIGKRGYKHRS
jgi:hypothetical protein